MQLVLASASPARQDILRRARFDPIIEVSDVDEAQLLAGLPGAAPSEKVIALATAKARDVASRIEANADSTLVLGCDSMFELDGELVGKPGDEDTARRRLHRMSGRTGILHTGHALLRGSSLATAHVATEVTLVELTDYEIEAYLLTGEPLAVAGGFTIDGMGGPFIEKVNGCHHNVIGLSLPAFRNLCARLGVRMTSLRCTY